MSPKAPALGVDGTLRTLSSQLESEIDGLVEAMLERMRAQVPDFDVDSRPELRGAELASCYGNVRAATAALGSDREPPSPPPAEAIDEARITARAGVPLESLLHTYRVGHAVVWEHAIDQLEAMNVDAPTRHAALNIGSRCLFAYVDAVSALVTQEYMAERDRLMRTSIQRRVQLVRDVLEGATVGGGDLGYDLDGEHLALVADGAQADAYLRLLERQLDRQLLTVAVADDVVWAWLGSQRPFGPQSWQKLGALPPPTAITLALGAPGWGTEGFRESHAQALAAHRVASRLSQPTVRYDDVALEATLMTDERAARRFIKHELGPLAAEDERASKLRITLEAYLSIGMNECLCGIGTARRQ